MLKRFSGHLRTNAKAFDACTRALNFAINAEILRGILRLSCLRCFVYHYEGE